MSKCQVDLLATMRALLVAAEIILPDTTTEELSASDAIIVRDALTALCEDLMTTMDAVISLYPTTLDTTSVPSASNGSDAFTWTYQQLSSTDWSGPPRISSSFTKWVYVGKPETSEGSGSKSLGSAILPVTSTNAYTCTTLEALKALNKSITEAEELRKRLGL